MKQFPSGFLFGSAVSAHQVEGGNANDWTEWEKAHAQNLARNVSRRSSFGQSRSPVWNEIKLEAKDPDNYRSGRAVDHYRLYDKDLGLAEQLGLNAFRFSIEWSRVEPRPGEYDQAAIQHYVQVAKACHAHGQRPMVTLHHFTLPIWVAKQGGWESPDTVDQFAAFARVMGDALRGQVRLWTTINEPEVVSTMGYLLGIWPPGVRQWWRFNQARQGLLAAHRAAAAALKEVDAEFQVGFCSNQSLLEPAYPLLAPAVRALDRVMNTYFADRLAAECDWIGLQYYQRRRLGGQVGGLKSDMGWGLYPAGHRILLERLARYGKPLYITESGLADGQDRHRAWYIERSLESIDEALAAGVDVRGYFHWSLLDNFEWHEGFWPKFGLISVERTTMARRLRPSARHYADLISEYRSPKDGVR